MNVHSLSSLHGSTADRQRLRSTGTQILDAALVCFAKRGFHQASMHDISAEAGISVGLIYRYFQNKDAVISAMADRHKKQIHEILERARQAPSLLESLEILLPRTAAKMSRVSRRRSLSIFSPKHRATHAWLDWCAMFAKQRWSGVTDLIARSPEAKAKWSDAARTGGVNFCGERRDVNARCALARQRHGAASP